MIRQAISCDICGAEKKQTNHWFVAWEQAGELRVSGWNSRNRLRTGAKHLCGQVCLHKLADDFMARVIAQKIGDKAPAAETDVEPDAIAAGGVEIASSARLLPAVSDASRPELRTAAALVTMRERLYGDGLPVPPLPAIADETARFATHNRRAEAWQRERERTQRGADSRPEIVTRRMGNGN